MTEKRKRKAWKVRFDVFGDLMDVRYHSGETVVRKIAVIVWGFDAGAMSAVIVNDGDDSLLGAKIHESMVALAVFCHAMYKLKSSYGMGGNSEAEGERKLVVLANDSGFGGGDESAGHTLHYTIIVSPARRSRNFASIS